MAFGAKLEEMLVNRILQNNSNIINRYKTNRI